MRIALLGEDETRGFQEIMFAMDELFDKVWYKPPYEHDVSPR